MADEETKIETSEDQAAAPEEPAAAVEEQAAPESGGEDDTGVGEVSVSEEAPVAAEPKRPRGPRKRLARAERHKHPKPAREPKKERASITRTAKPETVIGRRQERRGVVVSDKGDKSIVVKVETTQAHPRYKKVVRRSRRLQAHDERNDAAVGDVVRIVESRPLSKTKHWRLAEILEKAR
jgi:small subunit ribosomal protein S17